MQQASSSDSRCIYWFLNACSKGHDRGMGRYLATGERRIPWHSIRVPMRAKSGQEIPLEISFGEFVVDGRRLFSGFLRDFSERVRSEEALAATYAQLQRQAAYLAATNAQLEEQAIELEMQAEELAASGVQLHNRTREAEEAAAALRLRESQFRTMVDALPTLAWTARPDGYVDWYNARWYEYTGTTPADMEGWGWQSVHDPAALPEVMATWQAGIESGEPVEVTFPLRGTDGVFRQFLTRVTPLKDEQDQVVRWFGTNTDIEAEQRARTLAEAAAARTERLQLLTAALAGARTIDDVASIVVAEAATATDALTGMLALKIPNVDEAVIIRHSGLSAEVLAQYARFSLSAPGPAAECLRTGEVIVIEDADGADGIGARYPAIQELLARQGMRALVTVPLLVAGETVGVMSFTFAAARAFSASERTFFLALAGQAAQALERAALLQAERDARESAETANRAKTEFLSTMSHELRTPLNAIGGYAELIELGIRGPVTVAQVADLSRIRRASQHLQSLINDILHFARIEAGQVDLDIRAVRVDDVLADVEALLLPQFEARQIAYVRDQAGVSRGADSVVVQADPEKMRQILLNLVTNAIKFTAPGGRVTVSWQRDAQGPAHIRVADTGRGIPADALERIFEPFIQVDRNLLGASQAGIGLGLSISRDLARAMAGELTVESEVGVGSTFTLTLPAE